MAALNPVSPSIGSTDLGQNVKIGACPNSHPGAAVGKEGRRETDSNAKGQRNVGCKLRVAAAAAGCSSDDAINASATMADADGVNNARKAVSIVELFRCDEMTRRRNDEVSLKSTGIG